MREVDRIAIEDFGLSILMMMENAGRALATLAARKLRLLEGKRILCLAGKGGNGGGGLTASRGLANWGATVEVVAQEPMPGSPPDIQANVLRKAGVPVTPVERLSRLDLRSFDLVLDAVLGYGGRGNPSGPAADMVRAV